MDISPELVDECRLLLRYINTIADGQGVTARTFLPFRDALTEPIQNDKSVAEAMLKLGTHADDALKHTPEYFANLIEILARATRTSVNWRYYFGVIQTGHEAMEDHDLDCVLEVARRVLTLNYAVTSHTIENALKLVANICAGHNGNRKLIIQRNGVYSLLQLSQHKVTLNILIPALYNVCADYHDPASSLELTDPVAHEGEISDPGDLLGNAQEPPSLAVEQLAAAYSSAPHFATFELLLSFGKASSVGSIVIPFLADLVEMSTQPAVGGFDKIRSNNEPWKWTCSINGVEYDTINLATQFAQRGKDSLMSVCRTVLRLLCLQEARDALLRREDASLWHLMNIANLGWSIEDETFDADPDLTEIQTAFMKILYEITGDSSFSRRGTRTSSLIHQCTEHLSNYTSYLQSERTAEDTMTSGRNETNLAASSCVIISQLSTTEAARTEILTITNLLSSIISILESEKSPNVLYPAITIISRLSLTQSPDLPFINLGVLPKMQRLLTSKGLGLIVPFETVTAYKTIIRGRPDAVTSILTNHQHPSSPSSIITDILTLWSQTVDEGTKLETVKLFLELLRTTIHSLPPPQSPSNQTGSPSSSSSSSSSPALTHFLTTTAPMLAHIFAWTVLHASPPPQRQHGWFCLAMLSTWAESWNGILGVLDEDEGLRHAVVEASESVEDAVRGNVMLLVSRLRGPGAELSGVKKETMEMVESLATRLGVEG